MCNSKFFNYWKKTYRKLCKTLHWAELFLNHNPKTQRSKAEVHKWSLIKQKNFCRAKETVNGVKRDSIEQNICKVYMWQGLIPGTYKELNSIAKQTGKDNLMNKWALNLNRNFSKKGQNKGKHKSQQLIKKKSVLIIRNM